jgi:hypothetical protein
MGIKSAGYWTRTSLMLCSPLLSNIITFFVIVVLGQVNSAIVGFANHTRNDMKLALNTVIADSKTFNLDVYKNSFPKSCDVYFTDDYM